MTKRGPDTTKAVATDWAIDQVDRIEADTARYKALAQEHGADLSEEGFNEVLETVARHKR